MRSESDTTIDNNNFVQPNQLSHIKRIFRITSIALKIPVNNHHSHQPAINNSKYRFFDFEKLIATNWKAKPRKPRKSLLYTQSHQLLIPLKARNSNRIDNTTNRMDKTKSFDGPESDVRLQTDYYRSQVVVGDPIRAKRMKRYF